MEYIFNSSRFVPSGTGLVAEASDLGWRVGEWPLGFVIEGDDDIYILGQAFRDADGDLVRVDYFPANNGDITRVMVYND